jgi:hypothetical protein
VSGIHRYRSGISSVGQYQISGIPFLTGSDVASGAEQRIAFPYVARSVTVINRTTGSILVSFASNAANSDVNTQRHHVTLPTVDDGITLNVRCKDVWIRPSASNNVTFELIAELTGIPRNEMKTLSGSGINSLTASNQDLFT